MRSLNRGVHDDSVPWESVGNKILPSALEVVDGGDGNADKNNESGDGEGPSGDERDGFAVEVVADVGVALVVLSAVAASNLADGLALEHRVVTDHRPGSGSPGTAVSVGLAEAAIVFVGDGLTHVVPAELGRAIAVGLAVASVGVVASNVVDGALGFAGAHVAVVGGAVTVGRASLSAVHGLVVGPPHWLVGVSDAREPSSLSIGIKIQCEENGSYN